MSVPSDQGGVPATDGNGENAVEVGHQQLIEPPSFLVMKTGHLWLNLEPESISTNVVEATKVAFRELFQNFRDGMIESNAIVYTDFETEWKEANLDDFRTITIPFFSKVPVVQHHYTDKNDRKQRQRFYNRGNGDLRKLYGYIQFRCKQNTKCDEANHGEVHLVNFDASLTEGTFRMGLSTKKQPNSASHTQAGEHGEGLKYAARTFCAANISLIIENGWRNFKFKEHGSKGLYVSWTTREKTNQKAIKDWESLGNVQINRFENHRSEDVAIKIGSEAKGPSNASSRKVPENTFKEWLTITSDIKGPVNKISTSVGEVFFEQVYSGCVFLKGLKLNSSSLGNKKLQYGYNFHSATIGRERRTLTYPHEEAKLIQNIWGEAIAKWNVQCSPTAHPRTSVHRVCEDPRKKLVDLLRRKNESAEFGLPMVFMEGRTAVALWDCLLEEARLGKKFYYLEGDDAGARIVRDELGWEPEALSEKLWELLREKTRRNRTPGEEREHLFEKCERGSLKGSPTFSKQVFYILQVLLDFAFRDEREDDEDSSFKEKKVRTVRLVPLEAQHLDIQFLFHPDQGNLWINSPKCLGYDKAHQFDDSCVRHKNDNIADDIFVCDHHVEELFDEAIHAISQAQTVPISRREVAGKIKRANRSLSRMPRHLRCEKTNEPKELTVLWTTNERGFEREWSEDPGYVVHVHTANCSRLGLGWMSNTLTQIPSDHSIQRDVPVDCHCGGQIKYVKSKQDCVTLSVSDEEQGYFPFVAIRESNAVVAASLKSQKPRSHSYSTPTEISSDENSLSQLRSGRTRAMSDARIGLPSNANSSYTSPSVESRSQSDATMEISPDTTPQGAHASRSKGTSTAAYAAQAWRQGAATDVRMLHEVLSRYHCDFYEASQGMNAQKGLLVVPQPGEVQPPRYQVSSQAIITEPGSKRKRR